jgi:hypothetical protein
MKIYPVFHPLKLQKDPNDPLPGQYQEPQGPVRISKDGVPEYEVEEILDSSWNHPHQPGRKPKIPALWYHVKWTNWDDEDREWYPAYNFEDAPIKLKEFHDKYPQKLGPPKELDN